jgi:hypothetical protein
MVGHRLHGSYPPSRVFDLTDHGVHPCERFVGGAGGAAAVDNGLVLAPSGRDGGEAAQSVGDDDACCSQLALRPVRALLLFKPHAVAMRIAIGWPTSSV